MVFLVVSSFKLPFCMLVILKGVGLFLDEVSVVLWLL